MTPIPRTLLIHSADVRVYSIDPYWGGREPLYEEKLSFIRIEPMMEENMTADEEYPRLSGRLFFDCLNSRPSGFEFILSSKRYEVDFMGETYTVKKVAPYFDNGRLHHYEVLLG